MRFEGDCHKARTILFDEHWTEGFATNLCRDAVDVYNEIEDSPETQNVLQNKTIQRTLRSF